MTSRQSCTGLLDDDMHLALIFLRHVGGADAVIHAKRRRGFIVFELNIDRHNCQFVAVLDPLDMDAYIVAV